MPARKRLYLIDGYALIYRAFFAFIRNPLVTSQGENTSAVFGFTNSLFKIIEDHKPDYIGVVLDSKEPTFRHQLYKEYKATREKMPHELRTQLPRIREVIDAFHIPIVEMPGYEADDLIGALAWKAVDEGLEAVIVSGDKDFYQLINKNVLLLNPRKGGAEEEWIDLKNADEKFGVSPDKVIDVLGLMGDSSDNVPGVPGIGLKTAMKLIKEYGTIEAVYENLDKVIPKGVRQKLEENQESAILSKQLVTIETNLPVTVELEKLVLEPPDEEKLRQLFKELEFNTLLKKIGSEETEREIINVDYITVNTLQELDLLVNKIEVAGFVCLDLETTSLNALRADIVGISISIEPNKAHYIPVGHSRGKNLDRQFVISKLKPIFESQKIRKIGQNIKYDLQVLRHAGIDLAGIEFDTMVASYVLDPERPSHSLDYLADWFLDHKMISYQEVTGKGKSKIPFSYVTIETATKYACEDADFTLQLSERLRPQLEAKELHELYSNLEVPLIRVLADMEAWGVLIDEQFFADIGKQLGADLKSIEKKIYKLAGEEFNINSTKQLAAILFDKLNLRKVKKTKTGYSTDSKVLEKLASDHDLPRVLLDYRELAKLKSTYVDSIQKLVNPETGRIHTSYNQVVASTGRLSSSDPNLQNIPIRREIGRKIRKGFIAGNGNVLLSCDYSQIELRLMAHISQDKNMIEAFKKDEDIHRYTASLVFDVEPDSVTPEMRDRAKTVNFGILYGQGPYGLASALKISNEEAARFIEDYFDRYPGIKKYIDDTIAHARENGYVSTLLGRRRYYSEQISSDSRQARELAERAAINSPIQGTAADLIKIAMINIHKELKKRMLKTMMIIQVHDELVFETPEKELNEVKSLVKNKMEKAIKLNVPMKVDMGMGKNWFECK